MNSIIIRNTDSLKNILAWRDSNKDLVRQAPTPIIGGIVLKQGSLMVLSGKQELNYQRIGNVVKISYYRDTNLTATFTFDFDTWLMTDKQMELPFDYDSEEAFKDILTTYASTMAFMAYNSDKVIQDGVEFEINI